MDDESKHYVRTAMMLLEMGMDGMNPEHGTLEDYAVAAHSYLQMAHCGKHSWAGATGMVGRIKMSSAIVNMMKKVEK